MPASFGLPNPIILPGNGQIRGISTGAISETGNLLLAGLTTDGTGALQFPAATTSAGGIAFGTDTFLYRTGSAALALTGSLTASSSVISTTGIVGAASGGTGGTSYGAAAPIMLYVKSVTIKTSATPADIATITVPSGITRYRVINSQQMAAVAETASGTLAAANVKVQDASGGLGTNVVAAFAMPAAAGQMTSAAGASSTSLFTSSTLYLNQTSNSANAGTCSFYIMIQPLP